LVVRLPIRYFPLWGIRLHVWPSPETYREYGELLGTTAQRVHCHGWDLVSKALIGEVNQKTYVVVRSSIGAVSSYRVESELGPGRSVLRRHEDRLEVTLLGQEKRSFADAPLVIPKQQFHETEPTVSGRLSLTLAATAHAERNDSFVLAPTDSPEIVENPRAPIQDIEATVAKLDSFYRAEFGVGDRWASFVFFVHGRQVLMVRTYRNPELWQPVGGQATAADETPEATAIREVQEEAGTSLVLDEMLPLGSRSRDRGFGLVYAWYVGVPTRMTIQHPELVESRWFDIDEAGLLPVFPATNDFLQLLAGIIG
jgi:8-oxo-dGTP pyrophosphatase MutT (NUDIX family)